MELIEIAEQIITAEDAYDVDPGRLADLIFGEFGPVDSADELSYRETASLLYEVSDF